MVRRLRVASALLVGAIAVLVVGGCSSAVSPPPAAPSQALRPTSAAPVAAPSNQPAPGLTPAPGAGAAAVPPIPSLTPAGSRCPAAITVGAALGITVSRPALVRGAGASTPLPAGASAVVCDYRGAALNVIVERITNISSSYMAAFTARFPVPAAAVTGVGDHADSFVQALGGSRDNEGVVAARGSTIVYVVATDTPASLGQVEGLVSNLL